MVQAGGVAMKTLGVAGAMLAVLAGETGADAQAASKVRSKKLALSTVEVEKESLRMLELFMIWGN
jgi:hypothetical protein